MTFQGFTEAAAWAQFAPLRAMRKAFNAAFDPEIPTGEDEYPKANAPAPSRKFWREKNGD